MPPTGLLLVIAAMFGCGRVGFGARGDDARDAPDDGRADATRVTYPDEVLRDDPVAYFRLGEATGGIAMDHTGHGWDGAYMVNGGALGLDVAGAVGPDDDGAVRFTGQANAGDGSTAELRVSPTLSPWSGDFTIEAWVRPLSTFSTWNSLIWVSEDHMINGFRAGFTPDLALQMWSDEGGGTVALVSSPGVLQVGAWNHVAFVQAAGVVTMYVDGHPVGGGPFSFNQPGATAEVGSGAMHGLPFDGDVDELAIFSTALTQDRLTAHLAAAR